MEIEINYFPFFSPHLLISYKGEEDLINISVYIYIYMYFIFFQWKGLPFRSYGHYKVILLLVVLGDLFTWFLMQ